MLLRPELMPLSRPVAAAAAAAAAAADEEALVELALVKLAPLLALAALLLPESGPRRWLRNFSSRRHLARRLLNHTFFMGREKAIKTIYSLSCPRGLFFPRSVSKPVATLEQVLFKL